MEHYITLKCMHDICIACTANNLKQNDDEAGTANEFTIVCQVCEEITSIEQDTVMTILEMDRDNPKPSLNGSNMQMKP